MIPFAVLNSLVSHVKKGFLRVNSVMILVVLSTHAELASATARGARIVKRENQGGENQGRIDIVKFVFCLLCFKVCTLISEGSG